MKKLSIKSNGKEWLLCEVPVDAYDFIKTESGVQFNKTTGCIYCHRDIDGEFKILGTYTPSTGEIDFEVKEEWVEKDDLSEELFGAHTYRDYNYEATIYYFETAKESFISLLKAETEKAFPFSRHDVLNLPSEIIITEQKVMPSKLLVIEIK